MVFLPGEDPHSENKRYQTHALNDKREILTWRGKKKPKKKGMSVRKLEGKDTRCIDRKR